MDHRFDRDYYERFYRDPASRVVSRAEMTARGRLIGACARHLGLPVKQMLDAGCGVGLLRAPLRRALPGAAYTGIEVSEYLCGKYGWTCSSIEAYRSARPFDLVVCYDVLQYLDDRRAARALVNLARLCRGLLYFSALTAADWRENCDQSRTDRAVHLRRGEWYRERLRRRFREIGAGFWLRRGAPLTLWELETADRPATGREVALS
jgi:2-polyprenyl-3-methyl-5-hydroxy-6-metoxy-1,4-benzoquinol methylase